MVKRQNESVRTVQPQHGGNAADLECVRRIAQGDAEAVGDLYDRYATAMYSLALRIVQREAEAKDVVHEAFLQVWREAGRDEASQGVVAAWLLVLTRNLAVDCLRASRVERAILRTGGDSDPLDRTASANDDSARESAKSDAAERVREALNDLPVLHRMAIEMTYFEGLSQQEIASRLEQPVGTVKARIRVALRKLRAALTWEVR